MRLIARLDIKGPNVIKGVHLEGLRKVGTPNEMAKRYYANGIDEILFMDAVASLYGRNNILQVVSQAAADVFVPMTVGGGVRSLNDIHDALRCGADKVAINTAAIKDPGFLSQAANRFGSQCVALSVEAKRTANGGWEAMTDCGRERTGRDVIEWAKSAEALGAGEVLITSVDQEGTRRGFDLELMRRVIGSVSIPVIASGGGGSPGHGCDLFAETRADAAAFASIFHFDLYDVAQMKDALNGANIPVRLA